MSAETVHLLTDTQRPACHALEDDGAGSSIARETTCEACAATTHFRRRLAREKQRQVFTDVPLAAPARRIWAALALALLLIATPGAAETLSGPTKERSDEEVSRG